MAAPASAARAAMIDAFICATPTRSRFRVRAGSKEILGSAVKLTGTLSRRWMRIFRFGRPVRAIATAAGAVMLPSPSKPRNCSA
jgi:hypothetical protein